MQDATIAQHLLPEHELVAGEGIEIRFRQIVARGIESELDVIAIVDSLFLGDGGEHEFLEFLGRLGTVIVRLRGVPVLQIRMLLLGRIEVLFPASLRFLIELRGAQHVAHGLGGEDQAKLRRLRVDEFLQLFFLFLNKGFLVLLGVDSFFGNERNFIEVRVVEDAEQGVVIRGRDRIVFVVVAVAQATVRARKPRVVASTRSSWNSGLRA